MYEGGGLIMKMRKHVGNLLLVLATVFTLGGVASMLGVGAEEMPDSMKNNR